MPLRVIVGAQWGDEGKGRIVDWFASAADFVARYNGGDNAGHTVTVGERIFKLHLVPSGIIHPRTVAVMGNGMVINPATLFEEKESLEQAGIEVPPRRLRISYAAHLITPAHQAVDQALEASRGRSSLGTTGRGIGPAYTDKASRQGLRVGDMLDGDFPARLDQHVRDANRTLVALGAEPLDPAPIIEQYRAFAGRLRPFIQDTSLELAQALQAGKSVLAEAAQGSLLDLDMGSYPFVTSSTTTAPGVLTGLGLGLGAARQARVLGVVKAFQTRVGAGPFPTELSGDLAARLRGSGENPWDEYGTTTGRPRRVGWLDGVLLRYAVRINGLDELAVTKLDILSGLETVSMASAYRVGGRLLADLPGGMELLAGCEPVLESLPGWREDLGRVREWRELPPAARAYLERLASVAGVPVTLVSVGPERTQMVVSPPE